VWHVVACTGWRYDWVLDDMDLVRFREMTAYHRLSPPLHAMVRDFLGAGKRARGQPKREKAELTQEQFSELVKVADQTPPHMLAAYRGGRVPKIGEPLWQTTRSTSDSGPPTTA
jgi:hypothetical protein